MEMSRSGYILVLSLLVDSDEDEVSGLEMRVFGAGSLVVEVRMRKGFPSGKRGCGSARDCDWRFVVLGCVEAMMFAFLLLYLFDKRFDHVDLCIN